MAAERRDTDTARGGASVLDRRRRRLQKARSGADDAAAEVEQLERRIATNAAQGRTHEAALRSALDQVTASKKAIKASAKEAARLRAARKVARERAATAQQRSASAESRYDDAMLVDLLRREKERDLAAHTAPGTPSADHPAADETPDDDTARVTAARRTAARARSGRPAALTPTADGGDGARKPVVKPKKTTRRNTVSLQGTVAPTREG